jgi:mono/diheme cytochrome c family protein
MRPALKGVLATLVIVAVVGALGTVIFIKTTGLSARATPGAVETAVARRLRGLAVPSNYSRLTSPVLLNEESMRDGMAHFADHCAQCHGNDGSGDTTMGNGMFPPAPDMRESPTQSLSDGELFYIIEHGIRFTGMPAWGTGTLEGEEASWHLVSFIRHLPKLTPEELEEMAAMNPRSPAEVREAEATQRFLEGNDDTPAPAPAGKH